MNVQSYTLTHYLARSFLIIKRACGTFVKNFSEIKGRINEM